MRKPQFLSLIQSANTIIFFGVGLLLFGVLSYAAYHIYQETVRQRSVSGIVNTSPSIQNSGVKVVLGNFTPIAGTPYYMAPISAEQNYRQEYYDKSAISIRNYLLLNVNDRTAVRLVPKNNTLFLNAETVGQKGKNGETTKAEGLWYQVVKTDTNGDQRLTENDARTIAISDVSGKNYTEVVPRVDRLLGSLQPDPTKLMLIYETEGKNYLTQIDLPSRQITLAQELPAIE
jgi:hypothetical protein